MYIFICIYIDNVGYCMSMTNGNSLYIELINYTLIILLQMHAHYTLEYIIVVHCLIVNVTVLARVGIETLKIFG